MADPTYSYFDADGKRVLYGVSRAEALAAKAEAGGGFVAREEKDAPDEPALQGYGGYVVAPKKAEKAEPKVADSKRPPTKTSV